MVIVRRVRPDDAASLRELRLKALQSDPDAFGSSYEVEMGQPADKWVNRAGSASTGSTQFIAVADEDGRLIGMAGGYEPDDAPADRELWGMWVAPEWRGRGIGADLVRSVVDWAAAAGAERLTLWVVTTNTPAPSLYRAAGFAGTGKAQPLPSNPDLSEIELSLSLRT